ncbi:retropepsin-like aspartic protease family protein [Magnetofaba australis]|uniref:Putative aspartyl protease family protein n=1 Tax=Magnetofaba australis IT-1 TaxID=1434232 RepID=A0A1Y2K3I3_9PROT|nr:TIGR02281 family clan AA aspartic protease [Magnetofaba australis]OSM02563.1 putative aspartyl protease family protein [Magnetofaba australis IT-1]
MKTALLVAVAIVALILGGDWLLNGRLTVPEKQNGMGVVYLFAMSAWVGWIINGRVSFDRLQTLKAVAGWIALAASLVLLYGYRHELGGVKDRFLAQLLPGRYAESQQPGQMVITRSRNGHFLLTLQINGRPVRFLADTGASDIVLAPQDARAVGFNPADLTYDRVYHTANGRGRGASVKLREVALGDLTLHGVPASVNQAAMRESLLGMRFFNRLRSMQVQGDRMTLRW